MLYYLQTFFNSFFIDLSDCLSLIFSYQGPAVKENTTPLFSETHLPGDSSADKTKQSTPALIQKETSSFPLGINTLILLLFQGK